jgi:hypothetical protein
MFDTGKHLSVPLILLSHVHSVIDATVLERQVFTPNERLDRMPCFCRPGVLS